MDVNDPLNQPVFVCLNNTGVRIAQQIQREIGGHIHGFASRVTYTVDVVFDNTLDHIAQIFLEQKHAIVGICSSGILIRAIGPLIAQKTTEPPVIAVSSSEAKSVVPLLGGHHGANILSEKIAGVLGAHHALTTANGLLSLDEPPVGYRLVNPQHAKNVMALLANGGTAKVTPANTDWLRKDISLSSGPTYDVHLHVTSDTTPPKDTELVYAPQEYVLGIGCARGASIENIEDVVQQVLQKAGISFHALAHIATIDLKADEAAINALADKFGIPVRLYTASELEEKSPLVSQKSSVVFNEVGCHSVSEAAALCGVGKTGKLHITKHKNTEATAALAKAPAPLIKLTGHARGHLSIVGIGPGQSSWRTPEVTALVAQADMLVGYSLYLDLLGPLARGKSDKNKTFALGEESARCRYALEQAAMGQHVALVCSGDAGIYAMASLVYELLETDPDLSDAAKRSSIYVSPGISALQAAAAKAGAPLGHDFCTISLSDLLTPWETIQNRVRGAAQADFVVAFYNPVSQKRRTQLAWARDCLLEKRGEDTVVILGHHLGRPDERMQYCTLGTLCIDDVDMLTVVLVGSSQTRTFYTGAQQQVAYTPRGYQNKST